MIEWKAKHDKTVAAAKIAESAKNVKITLWDQCGGDKDLKVECMDKEHYREEDMRTFADGRSDPLTKFVDDIKNAMVRLPAVDDFDPKAARVADDGFLPAQQAAVAVLKVIKDDYVDFGRRYGTTYARKALLAALHLNEQVNPVFISYVIVESESKYGISGDRKQKLPNFKSAVRVLNCPTHTISKPTAFAKFFNIEDEEEDEEDKNPSAFSKFLHNYPYRYKEKKVDESKSLDKNGVEQRLLNGIYEGARTPMRENDVILCRQERFKALFPSIESLAGRRAADVIQTYNDEMVGSPGTELEFAL